MIYRSSELQQSTWSIDIDLKKNLIDISRIRMEDMGVKPSSDKEAVYEYFNLRKRLVSQRPRTIKKSKEFLCPKEYIYALNELEEKICNGDKLIPYLSDSILKSDFNDGLLNDWNIYHLHLTRQFRDDGFAKRSDFELFVYFTETTAYFIQIYPHNKKNLYSTQNMVRIIYDNWSQLIEKNRIQGIVSLDRKIDDEGYARLREANISTFVQIDDEKVFGLIGGGYMSNGFSAEALRHADYWFKNMRERQNLIVENTENIINSIRAVNGHVYSDMKFCLLWIDSDESITLAESNNKVIVQFIFKEGVIRVCKPYEVFGIKPWLRGKL